MFGPMDVRLARYEDLESIEEVAYWACSEAIGEMVPDGVVATEISRRFRKAVLSEHLLHELRAYWIEYKPKHWLFPGQKAGTHISNVSVSQVLYDAKKKSA